jgi:hypothetical protein
MADYDIGSPVEIPIPDVDLNRDGIPYPDVPATEIIHPQGRFPVQGDPVAGRAEGERYTTIEYIQVHQGLPMGPAGPEGPPGKDGADGGRWLIGQGEPSAIHPTGPPNPNDLYFDSVSGDIWYWNSTLGEWINSGSKIELPEGPQGPQGPQGIQGIQGPEGPRGGGILIIGTFANGPDCEFPPPFPGVNVGDGYIDTCRNLWAWIDVNGAPEWYNFGTVQGPQGEPGPGAEHAMFPLAFLQVTSGPLANVYAQMDVPIPDNFYNKRPNVEILIDYTRSGTFVSNNVVYIEYVSNTLIRLTGEKSIINHNGSRGWVVLSS